MRRRFPMLSRRQALVRLALMLPVILGLRRAQANPFIFFLRFLFGQALRHGLRQGLRQGARRGASRLGSSSVGRGRSRVLRLENGRVVRSAPREEVLAGASAREHKWTMEFIAEGLEELVWQQIDVDFDDEDDDDTVRIPDDAVVYELDDPNKAFVDILVSNVAGEPAALEITMYLYDIDAGLVDQKYPHISAFLLTDETQTFKVSLRPLRHAGRKVLCVKQRNINGRVSPIIYVT